MLCILYIVIFGDMLRCATYMLKLCILLFQMSMKSLVDAVVSLAFGSWKYSHITHEVTRNLLWPTSTTIQFCYFYNVCVHVNICLLSVALCWLGTNFPHLSTINTIRYCMVAQLMQTMTVKPTYTQLNIARRSNTLYEGGLGTRLHMYRSQATWSFGIEP